MQAKDAPQFQKRLAVFDVGGMWHSIYRRQCADLVTLELRFASKPSKFCAEKALMTKAAKRLCRFV
jgi:hypothetical protein